MTIYAKNREALEEKFPGWLEDVEKYIEDHEEEIEINLAEAYDGATIFQIKKENRILYLNGKYAPLQAVEKWVQSIEKITKSSVFVFIGIGSALYIKELLRECEPEVTIVIYEPSPSIFKAVLENVDLSVEIQKHKFIFLLEGFNGGTYEYTISRFMTIEQMSYFHYFIHPNYSELFPDEVLKRTKFTNRCSEDLVVYKNTTVRFMSTFANNLLHNIRYLPFHYKARQLKGAIPTDIPAIIISAGPSLNKNIKDLKEAKNKAFLIAVDTAIKPLLNHGIEPDVFVIVDGLKPVSLIEAEGVSNIPLITPFVAAKDVLEYHKGKKFFFEDGSTLPKYLFDMCKISFEGVATGGSVANNAFSLAALMGFKRIIFVGQDLALTGNKTHADGTFEEKMKEVDTSSKQYFEVDAIDGGKVMTRFDFDRYRQWFEDAIKQYQLENVIDATEGGALIKGTEVMTLKEAIEKECTKEVNIKELIDSISPVMQGKNEKRVYQYLCSIPQKLVKLEQKILRAKREYERIEKICTKKKFDEEKYIKACKNVKKITEEIMKEPLSFIIMESLRDLDFAMRSGVTDTQDDIQKEGIEVAKYGQHMLYYMSECEKVIYDLAEKVMGKLEENSERFKPFGE